MSSVGHRAHGYVPRVDFPSYDPVAVWQPSLVTDADGRVDVPFRLPASRTRRFSAHVLVQTTDGGVGEAWLTLDAPGSP